MAWLSDEAWEMVSDSINKKNIARSARSTRTHCGKSGAVKFPSDYKTRKELKAMNGEVETYRMNDPMSWEDFVKMPLDLQRTYIDGLRKRFNAPDQYIAEMFGKSHSFFIDHLFRLKMSADKWMEGNTWDREGFMAWRLGIEDPKADPVPVNNKEDNTVDILDRPMKFEQFQALTDEQKKAYIENLRQKFDVPNGEIAKVLGCSPSCISGHCRRLNVGFGRPHGSRREWNETGWNAWLKDANPDADETKLPYDEPEITIESLTDREKDKLDAYVQDLRELSMEVAAAAKPAPVAKPTITIEPSRVPIIPRMGEMNFLGDADDILMTLKTLLGGARVNLTVSWDIVNDCACKEE